ncbi:MAG: preprotein translocase subunit SecY [Verrucomicrobiales bacterium]|nr:preprotein translocase subunit SecY [Verrucomicrobiales bacterium]
MISAFANSLKIPELRARVFFTLAMVVVVRIGAAITLPGVDPTVVAEWLNSKGDEGSAAANIAALLNVFSGGGLQNCAIFALGIMPYISASIMMQLLTAVVPRLGKLAREDGGRQKINQFTRYAAIVLCVIQGGLLAKSLLNPGTNPFLTGISEVMQRVGKPLVAADNATMFIVTAVIVMTAGTMLLMWIGDVITERGIGNGMSLIISVNIISALPGAMVQVWKTYISGGSEDPMNAIKLVILFAFLLIVIAVVIALTQAQRRISIQYAKRVVGRKVYGGQTQYMPLKVNYSGVMPIIFAQAILLFPAQIVGWLFPEADWAKQLVSQLSGGSVYYLVSAAMIFFFSYFWVATMFQPNQIADDLKRNGGYIPGVRPGKPTADFLDFTMSRLTFAGAIFLTVVAILPPILSRQMQVPPTAAQFFGGTSVLILVGVLLDVMRQVETHLLQRHYDGFLRKGKIRGRFEQKGKRGSGGVTSSGGIIWLYVVIGLLILIGVSWSIYTSGN